MLLLLGILLFVAIFGFALYKLITIYAEYQQGEEAYEELEDFVEQPQDATKDSDGQTEKEPDKEKFRVDFDGLKAVNPDVVAWIVIPGLDISYPVVQGEDNAYYLQHLFTRETNSSGSIFVDFHNRPDFMDQNTIIYGHNMKNGSMFGSLKRYWDNEYYREHSSFYLYTAEGEIFLCHITDRRRISAQTDFFSEIQDKEEEPGEDGKTDRDARVTLVTCVAGKNEERLAIEADAKKIE